MLLLTSFCGAGDKQSRPAASTVHEIGGLEELQTLLDTSGSRLLVFDLYADWCMPCRILSPILERIAREHSPHVSFFKINIDRHPQIAAAFGVQGIPFVVFVRNREGLDALSGVHPPETYVRTINRLNIEQVPEANVDKPDGEIIDGVRLIRLAPEMAIGDLYVYRGETVRILMENLSFEYTISIPGYNATAHGRKGQSLDMTFRALEVGVFPVYCAGNCPAGDGSSYGHVIVMPYKGQQGAMFSELTARQAQELIESDTVLLLDVRTPSEYYAGHIAGAKLIPLAQLEGRVSEIHAHKETPVLIYCRSGNRSTVAAQILARHGFKTLHNLRPGLLGWQSEKLPVVKGKSP